jgi:hypothetical protein
VNKWIRDAVGRGSPEMWVTTYPRRKGMRYCYAIVRIEDGPYRKSTFAEKRLTIEAAAVAAVKSAIAGTMSDV